MGQVASSQDVQNIRLAIKMDPNTSAPYATQLGQWSVTHPVLFSIGFDDLVGKMEDLKLYQNIAQPGTVSQTELTPVPGTPADVQRFQSEPGLHPPTVTVRQPPGAGSAPGYVLAAPFLGPGQWGPMIFDNAGGLVWFRPLPAGQDAADFRTQMFR